MKLPIIFVLFLTTLTNFKLAHALETGFEVGNDFQAVQLRGRISFHCQTNDGRTEIQTVYCSRLTLEPAERARFVTQPGGTATEVEFISTQQSGKVRKKTVDFDAARGRSENLNLWIRTLLQKPLLDYGTNRISYRLFNDRGTQAKGEFTATVSDGGQRACPSRMMSGGYNCSFPQQACDDYFWQMNWCQ